MVQVTATPLDSQSRHLPFCTKTLQDLPWVFIPDNPRAMKPGEATRLHGTQLLKPDRTRGYKLFVPFLQPSKHPLSERRDSISVTHCPTQAAAAARWLRAGPLPGPLPAQPPPLAELPRKAQSGPNPAGRCPLPAAPGNAALCPG